MADNASNLMTLLQKIATERNYINPDIEITPVSTGGANYSSKLCLIKIRSNGKKDLRLFAKTAVMSEHAREQIIIQPFNNERFAYSELLMIYKELEDKNHVAEENKLALPEFYGTDATPLQEIVVLEDLACQGFVLHDRTQAVSWEYAAAAFTELAKFHALSFAFQHHDPAKFKQSTNLLATGLYTEHEANHVFYNSSMKSALASVRDENKEKLRKFIEGTNLAEFNESYAAVETPVIIHGDFRPSNMLHRLNAEGKLEVIVVDYQTIQAACPTVDLLFFIFMATDGTFRARYYQQLMEHYHTELGAALARLGLDVETVYSRKDFDRELEKKLSYGLHLSLLFLPAVLMPEEVAPAVGEDFSMDSMVDLPLGDNYVKRLNEAVDDYVAWGILK